MVCNAMIYVLVSLISSLYLAAHLSVIRMSFLSSSWLFPNRIMSSANSKWFIHPYIPGIRTPQYSAFLSFFVSISGMTLNHIGDEIPPCLTPF